MKTTDKFVYAIILIMGIIGILSISYFILFFMMNLLNTTEFSKLLINMNIYQTFYHLLNNMKYMAISVFIVDLIIIIPYIIISIVLGIIFIIKYVKYKGEKKKQIIKTIILGILTIFIIVKGISIIPLTSKYEIKVGTNVNSISNLGIKSIIKERLEGNPYVYKIEITRSFQNEYNMEIYYQDVIKKVYHTLLSDSYQDFINSNAKDVTNILTIKSILTITLGNILYIYFVVHVLKEFKRITM